MTLLRSNLCLALAAIAISCGGAKPTNKPPVPNSVDISIASVTLADDCGTPPTTEPPTHSMNRKPSPELGDVVEGAAGDRACEQSSVQLRVVNGTSTASSIAITKVEVLDADGAVVGGATTRAPSKWTGDSYQPWDGRVDAAQTLQISYSLSAPSVSAGRTYTVRVTLEGDKTLETKTTIEAPASLPPGAVT